MATWTEDGSGKLTVTGATVEYTGEAKGDAKANALWSGSGSGTWQFNVSGSTGAWVGVSNKDKFGPGWGTKGLFYGGPGNLSDGGGLVCGQWGPEFGEGDTVTMKVDQNGDKTTVAFAKNGQGLGNAFDIQGWSGVLQPAVSLKDKGQKITISEVSSPPAMERSMVPGAGIEGSWAGRFSASIKHQSPTSIGVSFKVANSMGCQVTVENGKMTPGAAMSTMMMPPEELQPLEREASSILSSLTNIRRDGDTLVIESGSGSEVFKFAPNTAVATKDQINWMK